MVLVILAVHHFYYYDNYDDDILVDADDVDVRAIVFRPTMYE